ncbi:MAG: carotenoid 1,2-hydratase [Armatimonadota bacterium]|nr:carotenoid 1,2-hydratase [Armatimonadota bacterium]
MKPFLLASLCLALACPARPATSFRQALPGYRYQFPRDHASHPAFQLEWWYYTGHLESAQGRRFGYQITFFRSALRPELRGRRSWWATRDIIFAHLAITDENKGRFYNTDRAARAALRLAGAEAAVPHVWIGNWALRFTGKTGDIQMMRASGREGEVEFALDLTQRALKPPIIHGQAGVSQKSAGQGRATHYYSFTRLATSGTLRLGNERLAVTGQSWFDHEFGSNQLGQNQVGWDWFCIQLADGRELMLYRLRLRDGSTEPLSSGTLIERNAQTRHLKLAEFRVEPLTTWRSPKTGAVYPARWRITLPRESLTLETTPTVADQELVTRRPLNVAYWEGSIRVTGTQQGRPLSGVGYLEMVGYTQALSGLS